MVNWIRGVNLGGWLVLERFITPYLFALTSCHLAGHFCVYPGQLGTVSNSSNSPSSLPLCHEEECEPILVTSPITNKDDYPVDEYTLLQQFAKHDAVLVGKQYLENHYDTFVTKQDIADLAKAGITHVRVPLPHWIIPPSSSSSSSGGDDEEHDASATSTTTSTNEDSDPWTNITLDTGSNGNIMWLYFLRLVGWCRDLNVQVWPDLHTAPGSQNGFDNSGIYLTSGPTCHNWDNTTNDNVNQTLAALQRIVEAIVRDGADDVVTGIGVLNEPYMDCDLDVVKDYNEKALAIVRQSMDKSTAVVIGDMFNATLWNDSGGFWHDTPNTYLDSHYYHVFAETTRSLSPKQHVALVCRNEARAIRDCCHHSAAGNNGMSRVVSEWSVAFDILPVNKLNAVMEGILQTGSAPELNRELTQDRRDFMINFCKAQMVVYEAADDPGLSSGWFYWNFKMEGGAFAEWDFLRGLKEGWIPELPGRNESSENMYGTCEDIVDQTKDDESIVYEYPDPETTETWKGPVIDDDYVVSHGSSFSTEKDQDIDEESKESLPAATPVDEEDDDTLVPDDAIIADDDDAASSTTAKKRHHPFLTLFVLGFFGFAIKKVFFSPGDYRRGLGYSSVHGPSSGEAVTMAV